MFPTIEERTKETKKERTVIMHKEPQGYGPAIRHQKPSRVVKLSRGGPGHKAGQKNGDAILMINGQPCKNSTHEKVWKMLQTGNDDLMRLSIWTSPLRRSVHLTSPLKRPGREARMPNLGGSCTQVVSPSISGP